MLKWLCSLCLCLLCWLPLAHANQESEPQPLLPEVVAAAKLSEMTGIALNPLLVGGGMRAWQYVHTPAAQRQQLHWTAQPWFWGSLLGIGLLFLLNNTIGRLIPPTAHAMDVVESLEGKLAPLYTSPLLIPVGIQLVQALDRAGFMPISSAHATAATGLWSDPLTVTLGTFVALFIMLVIWLSNQAIHTLVLLAPFAIVSWLVRLLQWGLLGLLLLTSLIHPLLGALFALLIIVVCIRIAGWSFRLTLFGMVFAWDWCCFKQGQTPDPRALAFSGPALKLPVRTLGYLQTTPQLCFHYRPWLILPRRQVPVSQTQTCLQHGISYSRLQTAEGRSLLSFPPRYRNSEQELAALAGCQQIQTSPLKSGLQTALAWLKEWSRT